MRNRICAALLLAFLAAPALAAVSIEDIEIEKHKYYDSIILKTSNYAIPRGENHKSKLLIDFVGGKFSAKVANSQIQSPRIKKIEVSGTRLIIRLNREVKFEMASLFGRNEVLIEVADIDQNLPATAYTEPQEVKLREPKAKAPRYPATRKGETQAKPPVLEGKVIVIDPGHGGDDPGAIGKYGTVEKHLTLSTSLMLASMLKKAGATVFMTRKGDIKKDLKAITSFANRIRPDAFVSVHYNYYESPSIKGTEVYYYNPRSRRLANTIQARLARGLRRPDRGVKKIMFYIIHHSRVPSIIVEPLYITNPEEAVLAKSKAYQKRVAWNIVAGLKEYFK